MPTKDEIAQKLIDWHFSVEPEITKVYRFLAVNEEGPSEPIKLLEVSSATLKTGRVDTFPFGPAEDIIYPSVVAQVTPEEMESIEQGSIHLPTGWSLDRVKLYSAPPEQMLGRR